MAAPAPVPGDLAASKRNGIGSDTSESVSTAPVPGWFVEGKKHFARDFDSLCELHTEQHSQSIPLPCTIALPGISFLRDAIVPPFHSVATYASLALVTVVATALWSYNICGGDGGRATSFYNTLLSGVSLYAAYQTFKRRESREREDACRQELIDLKRQGLLDRIAFDANPTDLGILQFKQRENGEYDYKIINMNYASRAQYDVPAEKLLNRWARTELNRPKEMVDSLCHYCSRAKESGKIVEWNQEMPQVKSTVPVKGVLGTGGDANTSNGKIVLHIRALYLGPVQAPDKGDLILIMSRNITEETNNVIRLELLMDAAADGFWEWNVETDHVVYGAKFANRLGYTAEEYVALHGTSRTAATAFHPEDALKLTALREQMMMSKPGDDELTLERRYLTKSGEYVWMLNKGKVVERDANGLPTRVVGANIDIGERKQTEEDLREKSIQLDENNRLLDLANKELSQALRFKSEFIANISHELRSPLNGIIGLGSVLWDTSLDEEQRELLRHVRDCSDGLLLIVNDVLDFSKIGAGKMMLEMISFDLRSCVQSAVSVTTTKAKEKNIHLSADLDPRIPPVLIGDGNRLRQVLINLVGNGVKFTSQGGVKVTVSVIDDGDLDENDPHRTGNISSAVLRSSTSDLTDVLRSSADLSSAPPSTRSVSTPADTPPATPDAEEPPVLVRFAIEDTGIGISADQFSRLFQPFSQVDASTAREFGGTGLGLAISKQLVHLMQPTSEGILVESKEGVGSTFSFTIPFRLPAAVNPHTGVSECAIESEASKKVKRITFAERMPLDILLAEDNKVNQKVALRMLLQFGYAAPKHITLANNGAEAVSLTNARAESKKPFQFILMDLQMPKLSGIEATKLIRQHHGSFANGGPAIIAMTANVMDSDKQNCYDAGMDGHIGKPFKIDALHDVLERFGKDLCARGKSNVSDNSINGSTQTNSPVSAPNSLETLHHSMSTITTATPRDSISTRTEIDGP